MFNKPFFKSLIKLRVKAQGKRNPSVLGVEPGLFEGSENCLYDVFCVNCKLFEAPVAVNLTEIELFELQNKAEIFVRKAEAFFGAALFAKVNYKVVD